MQVRQVHNPRDFDALRILLLDETGVNLEPSFGLGGPYEVQDGFVAIERPARPILANLAEQAVLDWVPLGRTWWIVCDRDVQTVLVAQLVLDAVFPCTAGCAVASASVSYDK